MVFVYVLNMPTNGHIDKRGAFDIYEAESIPVESSLCAKKKGGPKWGQAWKKKHKQLTEYA